MKKEYKTPVCHMMQCGAMPLLAGSNQYYNDGTGKIGYDPSMVDAGEAD